MGQPGGCPLPHSDDRRQQVLAAGDSHSLAQAALARLLGVSLRFLQELVRQWRGTGSPAALPQGTGTRPQLNQTQQEAWQAHVAAHPVALVAPAAPAGVAAKTRTRHATERDTPAHQQRRAQWRDAGARLAPARLVLVDESGVTTTMARRSGRGPRGERVHGDAPLHGWRVTTLLGAVALDGVRALLTVEAATDTEVCHALVEQVLVPALRPGDVMV